MVQYSYLCTIFSSGWIGAFAIGGQPFDAERIDGMLEFKGKLEGKGYKGVGK